VNKGTVGTLYAVMARHQFRAIKASPQSVTWVRGRRYGRRYTAVLLVRSGSLTLVRSRLLASGQGKTFADVRGRDPRDIDVWVLGVLRG
jgi:hypothetical protein